MYNFLKNKYFIALLLITISIFILMAISSGEETGDNFIGNTINTVVYPVQRIASGIGRSTQSALVFLSEISSLKQKNELLTEEVYQLGEKNRQLQHLSQENDRLREIIGLKERITEYDLIGAQIVAKHPGNWFEIFTIDKGTENGIRNKSAVITNKGLVGYVYEIGTNYARVMSMIDSDSSISAIIVRTRDNAVVKGELSLQNQGLCIMNYISPDADIVIGDSVETTGLGGIYPKGLYIGKIKEIKKDTHGISYFAIVEPAVDFKRLEEVFVINN
jgi:rod shape-determining protein MreC